VWRRHIRIHGFGGVIYIFAVHATGLENECIAALRRFDFVGYFLSERAHRVLVYKAYPPLNLFPAHDLSSTTSQECQQRRRLGPY
jgi:hypothetical protein